MVGVDQAQIDKILAGASSDDPEARLDNLEKELNFVKTSIKRLLIDLRERMNELDNPFTSAAASYAGNWSEPSSDPDENDDDEIDAISEDDTSTDMIGELNSEEQAIQNQFDSSQDEKLFLASRDTDYLPSSDVSPQIKPTGKLKLQRVHRLFGWVHQGCKKYGHEHMEIMIDAYRSMGYITDDASEQIREIMRMAPETRRDVQEIGPDEFVSELYILNRILDPEDSTLDRDMIEVLMVAHHRPGERSTKVSSHERDASDTWIDLMDRI